MIEVQHSLSSAETIKHPISTIMPGQPVDATQFATQNSNARQRLLQEVFLSRVRQAEAQVTMFLVNGVMLQGTIASYDLFKVEEYTLAQFGDALPDATIGSSFRPAFDANIALQTAYLQFTTQQTNVMVEMAKISRR